MQDCIPEDVANAVLLESKKCFLKFFIVWNERFKTKFALHYRFAQVEILRL